MQDVYKRQGLDHGFALRGNVDRGVLAGENAELARRRVQIGLHRHQALLEKDALAAGRRGADFGHHAVQFRDIGAGHRGRALRIVIGESDGDDAAFAVLGEKSVLGQFLPRIFQLRDPVHMLQVKARDQRCV